MLRKVLRRAGSVVLPAVLAAGFLLVTASPCSACSCLGRSPSRILRDADVAFVGTVVGERGLSDTTTIQVFEVEVAYKGDVTETMEIVMPIGPRGASSCGIMYSRGQRVAMAAYRAESGFLTTDVCSVMSPADLENVGGPGLSPSPDPELEPSGWQDFQGVNAGLPAWAVAGLGAVGGAALIAGAMWVGERRGRRKAGSEPAEPGMGPSDEAPEAPPG